jgi:hypothetical protein
MLWWRLDKQRKNDRFYAANNTNLIKQEWTRNVQLIHTLPNDLFVILHIKLVLYPSILVSHYIREIWHAESNEVQHIPEIH